MLKQLSLNNKFSYLLYSKWLEKKPQPQNSKIYPKIHEIM